MKFFNFLKGFDSSQVNYNFTFKGQDGFRTAFSGFLFLCYILVVAYFTIDYLVIFIEGKDKKINYSQSTLIEAPFINLKEINLNYAFGLYFHNNTFVPGEYYNKYFHRKIYHTTAINITKKIKKELELKECDQSIIKKVKEKVFCLKDNNITIGGSFGDEVFQYIENSIFINYSKFQEENMSLTSNIIDQIGFKETTKYIDTSIDLEIPKNYMKEFPNYRYKYLDYGKIIYADYYFSNDLFENYGNTFIFGDFNEYNYGYLKKKTIIQDQFTKEIKMKNYYIKHISDPQILFKKYKENIRPFLIS